jgi:hypothetical protein
MKTKFYPPLFFVVATGKDSTEDKKDEQLPVISPLSGSVDVDGGFIEVSLMLKTSSPHYQYGENIIVDNARKGIVFRYYHVNNPGLPDTGAYAANTPIKFRFARPANWNINDLVRVMYINESDSTVFNGLRGYFELKLATFGYDLKTDAEHRIFNAAWNITHPANPVYDSFTIAAGIKNMTKQNDIPRYTKNDGIFTLTLKP